MRFDRRPVKQRGMLEPWINTPTEAKGAPVGLKFGWNTGKKWTWSSLSFLETQNEKASLFIICSSMIADVDKLCPRCASSPSPFDKYSSLSLSLFFIFFIFIFLKLTSYSKKLPSGFYSASPGLCQHDCFYVPWIIWSLDESISSSVTVRIYFERML